jgi:myo-inositol-1(or 4)-monophosphatase
MNLEKITTDVCLLAEKAGKFIREQSAILSSSDIRVKGEHNFVTFVDEQSEQMIIRELGKILPGSGFIAEESPNLETRELSWVIDPLDGTTNFIHGLPLYSVSIALMEGTELLIGVVYEAGQRDCFYTWRGAASYLNGKVIRVSGTARVTDSLFATGFPYYDYGRLEPYLELFKHMMKSSRGIRRLGSAAADLAWVACGRFDGFYEYGLSPWDVAAGALIVSNAGGRVCDFNGGEDYLFGKEIVAITPLIFEDFMSRLRKFF